MSQSTMTTVETVSDHRHVLYNDCKLLTSNWRYRISQVSTFRLQHSFVHQLILELNTELNPGSNVPSLSTVCCACDYNVMLNECIFSEMLKLGILLNTF